MRLAAQSGAVAPVEDQAEVVRRRVRAARLERVTPLAYVQVARPEDRDSERLGELGRRRIRDDGDRASLAREEAQVRERGRSGAGHRDPSSLENTEEGAPPVPITPCENHDARAAL